MNPSRQHAAWRLVSTVVPEAAEVWRRVRASCRISRGGEVSELTFQALGSPCRVRLSASPAAASALADEIVRWVAEFEARYSRFLPTSLISRINAEAGRNWVEIDAETERLLALCHEIHFITRGTFDPTSLPLVRLWNWRADPPVVPTDSEIEAARGKVGWRKVQRAPGRVLLPEPGMALDLGGMGKEYAVDRVADLAARGGATSVLVDFGHDVRVLGAPPDHKPAWHIGLEDPAQPGQCWTGLAVNDGAVATSGDYLRGFVVNGKRFGHIIDIRTGRPVDNGCRAVSVIASSCSLAGMLATSAFVLGPEEGLRLLDATPQAEGCLLTEARRISSRRFYEHVTHGSRTR